MRELSTLITISRRRRELPPPPVAAALRRAGRLTQDDLAKELKVHRVTVARWELGQRSPQGALRDEYAEILRQLARELA